MEETISSILANLEKLARLEEIAKHAEEDYEREPENKEYEETFNRTYSNEFNAYMDVSKQIADFIEVDETVARAMVRNQRQQIYELCKESVMTSKKRLFIDMDGTLAEFKVVDTLETLYEKGYFRELKPQENVIDAVKQFARENPEVEIYIMSSVLTDSKYALEEKNQWLDRYLPEIDAAHRIFPPCGEDKKAYIPGAINQDNYLLDDYTKNLAQWEPPCIGIKLLNGINHTHGTWQGAMVSMELAPAELACRIRKTMQLPSLGKEVNKIQNSSFRLPGKSR